MGPSPTSTSIRQLPRALAATLTVVGVPIAVVSLLRASGAVSSGLALVAAGTGLSLAVSYLGALVWAARPGADDTVFGDLMLWGWLRRRRQERQVSSAAALLGLRGDSANERPARLSPKRRERLLALLAAALEARDPITHGHSRRVARHAAAIAKRMGLPRDEVARIRTAAAVHDVGKIETPIEIVNKPGALSAEEFEVIKRHPVAGARIVSQLGDEALTGIVRHHHERLDGRGYPDGLAGEEIPVGARVIAVADTFDTLTSTRPYRSARRHKEALGLLAAEAGAQLDPDAVRAFRRYYSGFRPIALWATLLNSPRQAIALLGEQLRFGGVTLATKATVTTVAAVAAGTVATGPIQPVTTATADSGAGSRTAAVATGQPSALLVAAPGDSVRGAAGGARNGSGQGTVQRSTAASGARLTTEAQPSAVDASGSGGGGTGSGAGGNRKPSPESTASPPRGDGGSTSPTDSANSLVDRPITSPVDKTREVVTAATTPVTSTVNTTVDAVDTVADDTVNTVNSTVDSTVRSVTDRLRIGH
jgi:putative nucleotidyltransferase with HDIG domain